MNQENIRQTIKGLSERENYFENNIKNHKSFKPELDALKSINQLIQVSPVDFKKIKLIIEKTESLEHYNGSGWHDIKIRLNYLAFLLNEKTEI